MDNFTTYYSKAATLCSRAEKCSSDIKTKLLNWGADEEIADKVLKKLINEKFIDDNRYACFYVKDKFRFNKWGRIKIAYMLRQKNISSEIISLAMEEIDDRDYEEILRYLLTEKLKKITAKNQYDKRSKLLRFAQGKGFELDICNRILNLINE